MKIVAFAPGFRPPLPKLKHKNIAWILILYSLPCKLSITFHGLSVSNSYWVSMLGSYCPSEDREEKGICAFLTGSQSPTLFSGHHTQPLLPSSFLQWVEKMLEVHCPCQAPTPFSFQENSSQALQIIQSIIGLTQLLNKARADIKLKSHGGYWNPRLWKTFYSHLLTFTLQGASAKQLFPFSTSWKAITEVSNLSGS